MAKKKIQTGEWYTVCLIIPLICRLLILKLGKLKLQKLQNQRQDLQDPLIRESQNSIMNSILPFT